MELNIGVLFFLLGGQTNEELILEEGMLKTKMKSSLSLLEEALPFSQG